MPFFIALAASRTSGTNRIPSRKSTPTIRMPSTRASLRTRSGPQPRERSRFVPSVISSASPSYRSLCICSTSSSSVRLREIQLLVVAHVSASSGSPARVRRWDGRRLMAPWSKSMAVRRSRRVSWSGNGLFRDVERCRMMERARPRKRSPRRPLVSRVQSIERAFTVLTALGAGPLGRDRGRGARGPPQEHRRPAPRGARHGGGGGAGGWRHGLPDRPAAGGPRLGRRPHPQPGRRRTPAPGASWRPPPGRRPASRSRTGSSSTTSTRRPRHTPWGSATGRGRGCRCTPSHPGSCSWPASRRPRWTGSSRPPWSGSSRGR